MKQITQFFLKGESSTLISGSFNSKENSEKAFINAIEIYSQNYCHEDLQVTKVMQMFQEMGLVNISSTRPVNLSKPIPNTFNKI